MTSGWIAKARVTVAVLSLAATGAFCVSVQSQTGDSSKFSKERKGLKCPFPKVEIVSRQLFNANGQTVESPVSLTEYTICDEQRREIESGELLNGDPDIKWVSKYDENGNEIQHEFWTHDSLTSKSVSRYDNSGRMTSQFFNDRSKAYCRHMNTQSSCRLVDADGKLKKRWLITSDSKGREILRIEFEPGRPSNRYVYAFDGWGNRNLAAHYYRSDGKDHNSRELFTFNAQGKLVEKLWHDETGLRTREVYDYNSKGDLIRRVEYDANNWTNEQVILDYQSYDPQGNWSKAIEQRVMSRKGQNRMEIRRVLYRTLTYLQTRIAFVRN